MNEETKNEISHLRMVLNIEDTETIEDFIYNAFQTFIGNTSVMRTNIKISKYIESSASLFKNHLSDTTIIDITIHKVYCNSPTVVTEIVINEDYKDMISLPSDKRIMLALDSKNQFASDEDIESIENMIDTIILYCKSLNNKDMHIEDVELLSLFYTSLIDSAYKTESFLEYISCEGFYHKEIETLNLPGKIEEFSDKILREICKTTKTLVKFKTYIEAFKFVDNIKIYMITKEGEEFEILIGIKASTDTQSVAGTIFIDNEFDNGSSFLCIVNNKYIAEIINDLILNNDAIKEAFPDIPEMEESDISDERPEMQNIISYAKNEIFNASFGESIEMAMKHLITHVKEIKGTDRIGVKFKASIKYHFNVNKSYIDDVIKDTIDLKEVVK